MRSTDEAISSLISLAAVDERCARLRTSLATTAKPRPCSPARAASTAAFSARMLVWKAMPSMMPVMSAILLERSLMSCMVDTTWLTTVLPFCATSDALAASAVACCALSAFCFTVEVSSSMLAAVSCSDDACASVRWLRSALPAAICLAAPATLPLLSRTLSTISVRRPFMSRRAESRWLVSSLPRTSMRLLRSPRATVLATSTATRIGCVIERVMIMPAITASSAAPIDSAISMLRWLA